MHGQVPFGAFAMAVDFGFDLVVCARHFDGLFDESADVFVDRLVDCLIYSLVDDLINGIVDD